MEAVTRQKKLHKKGAVTFFDMVLWFIMLFAIVIVLYPVLRILAGSFSNSELLDRNAVGIIPKGFTLANYMNLFQMDIIWSSYLNTVYYTVVAVAVGVTLTATTAYPLSKRHFVGRRGWNMMLLFTMLFSGGLIPAYLVVTSLGMSGTVWSITVPGCVSAWNVILMRTFFESIPASMEESAKIDGANDFVILLRIYIPLSLPIIATLSLFFAVGKWNDFFGPLLYLQQRPQWPLALLLRQWLIKDSAQSSMNDSLQLISQTARNYTAIVVTSVPIICVYPFIQKYFARGMMVGAVKG